MTEMKHFFIPAFVFMSLVALCLGCGPKAPYDLVLLEGNATYAGKPIPKDFRLSFQPLDGKRSSSATIKTDDGKFATVHTLSQDGVPKGKCQVTVVWGGDMGTSAPPGYEAMLAKYGFGTAGHEFEFTKNNKKFKLDFPE
jgi:hypothetical protein